MLCDRPVPDVARAALGGVAVQRDGVRVHHGEDRAVPGIGDDEVLAVGQVDPRSGRGAAEQVDADEVGDVARPRPGGDLLDGAVLREPAVLEDEQPVGQRERVDRVVGDEEPHAVERREVAPQLAPDLGARADVERGERLVEEEQAGVHRQRAGERDPLGLPAGELLGLRRDPGPRARSAPATRRRPTRASGARMPRLRSPKATFSRAVRCGNSR